MGGEENLLRQIPPMDRILELPAIREIVFRTSRAFVQDQVTALLAQWRDDLRSDAGEDYQRAEAAFRNLEEALREHLVFSLASRFKKVINATGVILHTNLGRSPLAKPAVQAVTGILESYSNLEFDLQSGQRGHRDEIVEPALRRLLGCESATAVNNNAAAIFLVLNELASGGEVIVSRGELIEIGGSFRIPDILARSNAVLREVGTTNKTRLSDYAQAVNENTRLLLKIHPSNYRVIGFTESVSVQELAVLARERTVPLVEDLGSGLLLDLSAHGITGEPIPAASLAAGADLITFSCDKLLGGPQAGIIAGRQDLVQRTRRNPLMRAMRLDKMTLAALESTLRLYLAGTAAAQVPILRMICQSPETLRQRASRLNRKLQRRADSAWRFEQVPHQSAIGGGTCAGITLPSWAIAVSSATLGLPEIERRLRGFDPPIVARIEGERLLLDVRTLFPSDSEDLARFFAGTHPESS